MLRLVEPFAGVLGEQWLCFLAVTPSYGTYRQKLYKEALVCSYLNCINGTNFVPLLGIHSSRDHPFALVFEFMGHGNLYSSNNQNIRRMDLVTVEVGLVNF